MGCGEWGGGVYACVHMCVFVFVCVTGFEGYGCPTTASSGPGLLES